MIFQYVSLNTPARAARPVPVPEYGMTVEDMAKAYGCSKDKIYNMLNAGTIPARKAGGSWVISITAWNNWFKAFMADPKSFHSTARPPKKGSISSQQTRVQKSHATGLNSRGVKGRT